MFQYLENRQTYADYLFIEADEGHIAEQRSKSSKNDKRFNFKLIYVHEGKFELG